MSDVLLSIKQVDLPPGTRVSFVSQPRVLVLQNGASTLVIPLNPYLEEEVSSFLVSILSVSTSGDRTLSIRRDPQSPQPLPVKNDLPLSHNLLISEVEKRRDFGAQKYGQALQAENGRNAVQDALEEVIDAAVYLINEREEQKKLAEMLDKLLNKFALGDKIYDVRDRAVGSGDGYVGDSWEHPKVLEFQEMLTYFGDVLKRLRIVHG